jgi:hypothetical protein
MAAGLGFKDFVTGEVLTAADVDGYLMQGIWVFDDAAARDAAVTSPQEGNACYLKDTNEVLTYSGSVWVAVGAAASSGANFTLLNSGGTALTGAQTITVSGISGKDKIAIVVDGASSASASSTISIRLNTDTGANYYTYGNRAIANTTYSRDDFRGWAAGSDFNSIRLGVMSTSTGSDVYGFCLLTGCNASGLKMIQSNGGALPDGASAGQFYNIGGYYNSASTISSISVFSASGNFDAGTVYVYTSA